MMKKILKSIFSVTNEYKDIFKIKVITVLGVKAKFKNIDKKKLQESLNSQKSLIQAQKRTISDLKIKNKDLEKRVETNYKVMNVIANPSQCPKAKGELRQHQLAELEIMKVVKKLCDENKLSYWLDFGTLLGAVRHKGFIPWDGDADICMLRDDYLRLIPLLKEYYKDSDTILVRELLRCKSGWMNYQIRIRNKGDKADYGIDIFPVDKYYKDNVDEQERDKINQSVADAMYIMQDNCKQNPEIAEDINQARDLIYGVQKEIVLENQEILTETPVLFYAIDFKLCSMYPKVSFDYDTIFPLRTVEFEGEKFYCPNNTDELLSLHYSNKYMQFPSKIVSKEDKIDEYIRGLYE